jgi:kinesin family member 6/9
MYGVYFSCGWNYSKTHTMSGSVNGGEDGYGVCARAAMYLFQKATTSPDTFAFRLSVLEIYNENLIDLLAENSGHGIVGPGAPPPPPKLNVIDTEQGVIVPGLHILPIDSADEAINYFIDAQSNRAVAEHQLNRRSSRSHVIYTYYVTRTHMTKSSNGGEDPVVHQSK